MNKENKPINLPQTPVYDEIDVKPSEAFDHDGGIDNRLKYIKQEFEEVIKPLNHYYSQASKPGALADVRLLKRLDNFFIWFDEIPLELGLESALRPAFEIMQGMKWPNFRRNQAADCVHNCEFWGWVKIDDQSNQWPKHINEEWDAEEDEEPPEDPEPEVREATPERKVPYYNLVVYPEQYGHNGLVPGQTFSNQKAAVEHGAHADLTFSGVGAGCRKGAGQTGAYSVIVANKYGSINEDCGDVILYARTGALNGTSTTEMHKANK